MADVQLENGYVRIANDLFDAICNSGFTAMEIKVVLAIARYTYGYNRKEAEISLGTIAKFLKYKGRSHVSEAVTHLIQMNVICATECNGLTRTLSLNKDFDTWRKGCSEIGNCSEKGNRSVPETGTEVFPKQEQILYTDNNKNNIKDIYSDCSEIGNCSEKGNTKPKQEEFKEEFEELWKLYPKKRGKSAVSKKAMKELQKAGFDTVKRAIENYKAEIKKNRTQDQYIMHGSTFFNGRWRDYIADENEVTSNDPYANIGLTL